jgi:hypothetical protein
VINGGFQNFLHAITGLPGGFGNVAPPPPPPPLPGGGGGYSRPSERPQRINIPLRKLEKRIAKQFKGRVPSEFERKLRRIRRLMELLKAAGDQLNKADQAATAAIWKYRQQLADTLRELKALEENRIARAQALGLQRLRKQKQERERIQQEAQEAEEISLVLASVLDFLN